jgi:putative ABC transport system permease protein
MVLFTSDAPPANYTIVKVSTDDMEPVLTRIQKNWKKINPDEPFEYTFLNEEFQKNYEAEQRISSIIWYFTFIAIFISCLGLFGLAAFTAERRMKEIGIRKVLGASVSNIVMLLSKEFMILVVIAFLIATPIAWYGANRWLETFAYRIDTQWWIFAVAGLLALVIAIFTISFQSIRAAVDNPIERLRSE